MVKGLYVASTALVTNTHRIDAISNNLANVNSSGFKKDRVEVESFNDRLFTRINGSNYPYNTMTPNVTMTQANNTYNLKTDGGYFRVQTDEGVHYDNEVVLIKDIDGYLRTKYENIGGTIDYLKGNPILGSNGPIYVGDGDFTVDAQGNLSVDGSFVDNIAVSTMPTVIGTMGAGIKAYKIATDFEAGQLEVTNSKYDVALQGDGFFNIATPEGTMYTRNGAFTINQYDELVTMDGYNVMGLDGPIIITSENFSINEFGEVIQENEISDKLTLSNFTNVADLKKVGGTFFKFVDNPTGEMVDFEGEVKQGVIEHSNVDAISEMINLIEMNRNYESNQKVVTTIDELIGNAVNDLGRV
jgi:flagellar basal-body rod protein FlgG